MWRVSHGSELLHSAIEASAGNAENRGVDFTRCPYDGAQLSPEGSSRGGLILACTACGAAWVTECGLISRLRGPDRELLIAERLRAGFGVRWVPPPEPLPVVPQQFQRRDDADSTASRLEAPEVATAVPHHNR